MKNIEETLWEYIDGNCTPAEQKEIIALISADETVRLKYQGLLNFNKQVAAMDQDEPSMAFTYNVMEAIRTEYALVPLKAPIDKKMILVITSFFLLTILSLLVYAVLNSFPFSPAGPFNAFSAFKVPDFTHFNIKPVLDGFVFFDVVMALYIFDAYLRKKKCTNSRNTL
jgi:hypothetical protein